MLRPARRLSAAALVLAAVALSTTGCAGKNAVSSGATSPQLQGLPVGRTGHLLKPEDRVLAPTIKGETLDGQPLDVTSLRGKVVVLNFWASWCSPCRAEAPNLAAVARATASHGVQFVGIDIKDERGPASRFAQVHDVPYPSLFDQSGLLLTRFHSFVPQSPPTTLLLDRQGRIAAMFAGGLTADELSAPVLSLAGEAA